MSERVNPATCAHPDFETVDGVEYCTACGVWRGASVPDRVADPPRATPTDDELRAVVVRLARGLREEALYPFDAAHASFMAGALIGDVYKRTGEKIGTMRAMRLAAEVLEGWGPSPWTRHAHHEEIVTDHGSVTLEPRPAWCDRGRFVAKVFPAHGASCNACDVDEADAWPRYYFDAARAKAEIAAWLAARGWRPS